MGECEILLTPRPILWFPTIVVLGFGLGLVFALFTSKLCARACYVQRVMSMLSIVRVGS